MTRSRRDVLVQGLWLTAGVVVAALGLGWVLWWSPSALVGASTVGLPANCWLSPPAYGAALVAWGCFRRCATLRRR